MQRAQRIVFSNIGGQHQEKVLGPNDDPIYLHNTMIFEIGANWDFINELMSKFHNKSLEKVDPVEGNWLNFILNEKIEIDKYKTSDDFIEACFKNNE